MPDQAKTRDPKTPSPKKPDPAEQANKTVPDPTDDRPQREDEYLSKFLQDTSPESTKGKGGEIDKE